MIDIDPNSNGLPGIAQLRDIVGAVMTVGLILSVLALIVSAIVWGFGANSSNPHLDAQCLGKGEHVDVLTRAEAELFADKIRKCFTLSKRFTILQRREKVCCTR